MEITPQEALDCFASDDLIGLGMEADAVRRALHPENVVTYTVPCDVDPGQPREDLLAAVERCVAEGGTTVCMTRTHGLAFSELKEVLSAIRQRFPSLRLHALSTSEILDLASSSGLERGEILTLLRVAGLDSFSGDDLSAVPAPGLVSLDQWLDIHRQAHRAGIVSSAGFVFGIGETSQLCIDHLFALRALQAQTSGFTSFTLMAPPPGAHLEAPTAVEYLRGVAIARMILDNIRSVESSCLAQGLKVVQMALRFGANDAGSLIGLDKAWKAAFTEEDLRRVIRDAGFIPVERDPLYRTLFLNN